MTDHETARREMALFFLLRFVKSHFNENSALIDFPLVIESKWEVGKKVEIGDSFVQTCYLIRRGSKEVQFFIEDEDYFVMGNELDGQYVTISIKYDLRSVRMSPHEQNPN